MYWLSLDRCILRVYTVAAADLFAAPVASRGSIRWATLAGACWAAGAYTAIYTGESYAVQAGEVLYKAYRYLYLNIMVQLYGYRYCRCCAWQHITVCTGTRTKVVTDLALLYGYLKVRRQCDLISHKSLWQLGPSSIHIYEGKSDD